MSRFLKDIKDLKAFRVAVKNCKGDVILRKNDGSEEFNMKSELSEFVALGKLADMHGESYEVFCMNKDDEPNLLEYFFERDE